MAQDPSQPPTGGEYIPPPPPAYPVNSDIPPDSPYHYSPAPTGRPNRGILGGLLAAIIAVVSKGGAILALALKIPAMGTLLSLVLSFGGYALFWGWQFAAALVVMILIHEMGHVIEIQRQGMKATAPIFIPFMGAAIFQRSHPTDALKQAKIGIAGPLLGTVGATAAFALYGATKWDLMLLMAMLGFYINLFNLIPISMLDGGWILAPVSKWFMVAGYGLLAVGALFAHLFLNPLVIIIAILGIPMLIERFRNANNPYYTSVPVSARWAMGGAWLALVVYLGVATVQTSALLGPLVR